MHCFSLQYHLVICSNIWNVGLLQRCVPLWSHNGSEMWWWLTRCCGHQCEKLTLKGYKLHSCIYPFYRFFSLALKHSRHAVLCSPPKVNVWVMGSPAEKALVGFKRYSCMCSHYLWASYCIDTSKYHEHWKVKSLQRNKYLQEAWSRCSFLMSHSAKSRVTVDYKRCLTDVPVRMYRSDHVVTETLWPKVRSYNTGNYNYNYDNNYK